MATVKWGGAPVSVLRSALANGRAARLVGRWDHIWARILDVPAALDGPFVHRDRPVVVEVADPFMGRGGRFALDVSPAGASASRPPRRPPSPCRSTPSARPGSGAPTCASCGAAGTIDEHTVGAVDRLGAALRWHQTPYCATDF